MMRVHFGWGGGMASIGDPLRGKQEAPQGSFLPTSPPLPRPSRKFGVGTQRGPLLLTMTRGKVETAQRKRYPGLHLSPDCDWRVGHCVRVGIYNSHQLFRRAGEIPAASGGEQVYGKYLRAGLRCCPLYGPA